MKFSAALITLAAVGLTVDLAVWWEGDHVVRAGDLEISGAWIRETPPNPQVSEKNMAIMCEE